MTTLYQGIQLSFYFISDRIGNEANKATIFLYGKMVALSAIYLLKRNPGDVVPMYLSAKLNCAL